LCVPTVRLGRGATSRQAISANDDLLRPALALLWRCLALKQVAHAVQLGILDGKEQSAAAFWLLSQGGPDSVPCWFMSPKMK
jgi:hypothetical protein